MPDVAFTWLPDERPPPPAWANRLAVARGTLSRVTRRQYPPAHQLGRVLTLWRNQLARLRRKPKHNQPDYRWSIADSKRLPWLRNCPPYGVCCKSPKKLRRCDVAYICPWCWGRRVVARAYDAACRALKKAPDARLVVLRWITDRHRTVLTAQAVQRSAFDALKTVITHWKGSGAIGGVGTWTVAPKGEFWRTTVRLLLILPGETLPAELEDSVPKHSRVFVRPDKRDAVRAAALFGRYPGGLLTQAPCLVSDLLTNRPKGRHLVSFGVCNAGFGVLKPRKKGENPVSAKTISTGDSDGPVQLLEEQDQAGGDRGRPGGH
jgi:hypothetical protein